MAASGDIKAGAAFVELFLKSKKFFNQLKQVASKTTGVTKRVMRGFNFSLGLQGLHRMNSALKTMGVFLKATGDRVKVIGNSMMRWAKMVGYAGIGGLLGMAFPLKEYMSFDNLMQELLAKTGATVDEMARLREQARHLGRTTSFSPQEIAGGQVMLARGGFGAGEIESSTEAMLLLAKAANTDLVMASDTTIKVIRSFGLAASESGRVADVISTAVNSSAQNIDDFGEAIKTVGGIAEEANETIETVSAAIGMLADNGVRGTLAGTGLRRVLFNVSDPATVKRFKDLANNMGVKVPDFKDARGNLKPLVTIMGELGTATAKLGTGNRIAIFETLFGRGTLAALKLANNADKLGDYTKWIDSMDGAAKRISAIMDARIGGAFFVVKSAFQDMMLGLGSSIQAPMDGIMRTMAKVINSTVKWIEANSTLFPKLMLISTAAVILGGTLFTIGIAINTIGYAMAGFGSLIAVVSAAFEMLLSPIGAVVLLAGAASVAFFKFSESGKALGKAISEYLGGAIGRISEQLGAMVDWLIAGDFQKAWEVFVMMAAIELERLRIIAYENFGGMIIWMSQTAQKLPQAIAGAFNWLQGAMTSSWQGIQQYFMDSSAETQDTLADYWEGMYDAFGQATSGMWDDWAGFVGGLKKLWAWAGTLILDWLLVIAEQANKLVGMLDYLPGVSTNAADVGKWLEEMRGNNIEGRDDRFRAIDKETKARRKMWADEAAQQAQASKARLQQLEFEADALELEALRARKSKEDRIAEIEKGGIRRPDFGNNPNAFLAQQGLDELLSGLASAGSFNTAAAFRLGAASLSPGERAIVNQLEKVNDNLQGIEDGLRNGKEENP